MLEYVLSKVSYRELGYDRTTIFRARKRQIRVSDNMLKAILKHLSEEEFTRIAGSRVKLESLGVVRRGAVDYSLVIEILELAKKDKFLKNLIAKWFVENVQYEIPHIVKVKEEHVRKFEKFLKAKRARKTVRERLRYLREALYSLDWELTPEKLEEYILELQEESVDKAQHAAKALKLFIKTVLKDPILYNSFKVPRSKERMVATPLSLEQVVKVAKAIKDLGAQTFYVLLAETGLRPGEILGLTLEDVDLVRRKIVVGKLSTTKKAFITFLHRETALFLKEKYLPFREEFIKQYERVIPNLEAINVAKWRKKLLPFKEWSLRHEIYEAMDKALGFRFRLYDLRAFFSAYMTKNGVSPLVINILQGRVPPREFRILQQRYLPFTEEDLREIYSKFAPKVATHILK